MPARKPYKSIGRSPRKVDGLAKWLDLESGRLVFLAHGLDQMFGVWRTRPDHSITPQMRGLVAKAVLQTAEGRRRSPGRPSKRNCRAAA